MHTHNTDHVLDLSGITFEGTDDSLKALDTAWEAYRAQAKQISLLSALHLFRIVQENMPNAHTVVLREDTTHMPAHGHVHDILDANGTSLMPDSDTWHDLDWTHEVEDFVWDIYETYSIYFMTDPEDKIRKLYVTYSGI